MGLGRVGVGDEAAERGVGVGVELHVESDGAAGLGAAADVVELEATNALLPSVWWPTTRTAGASKGVWKAWARAWSSL